MVTAPVWSPRASKRTQFGESIPQLERVLDGDDPLVGGDEFTSTVSRFPPPSPIDARPRSNSPPSGLALPSIGPAAKPIAPPAGRPIPAARPIDPAAAAIGEPDRVPLEPPSGACLPADAPSWRRKSSAISRSMPGRTSRPANWASTPTMRGAAIRASTHSTTCTAAVRPNRPIKARGSGSLFLMVPFATASAMTTPTGFHRYCTAPGFLDTRLRYAAWRSSYSSRASLGVRYASFSRRQHWL